VSLSSLHDEKEKAETYITVNEKLNQDRRQTRKSQTKISTENKGEIPAIQKRKATAKNDWQKKFRMAKKSMYKRRLT